MRRYLVVAIALGLAGLAFDGCAATAAAAAPAGSTTTQLPRDVRPLHYAISVTPHADKLSFDGSVAIDIEVLRPTRSITLNALDMRFASARLAQDDGKHDASAATAAAMATTPATVRVDDKAQTATFAFARPIAPGRYTLSMDYIGKIGTQANGLFAIDYDTAAGKRRALYTQFENSDARRFIPSWDEPAYKATFDLSVIVPAAEMAVSNMPVAARTELGNGVAKVTFRTSPKMSTYLLFFGLGDFERATTTADGTEIGVITQKGKRAQADFTLQSASAVLKQYNDYFGVRYPLPKLDNIAAPGQSQFFSAMENWGAIFTFEYALLLDPSISTQGDKEQVFNTAAHEMAHQWFGDLVTMVWWDDLWLNEGFASWMAGRITEKLHPEWNTALDAVAVREGAMSRDAVATTHPVVQHVETVEQASQAFDAITYAKGEAVIRMLEGYVGAEAWRQGVRDYIKAHAYGNTVSDDLWHAMDGAAGGKPITTVAHDFTLQPGVPLIKVESAACSDGATTIGLSQGEFTKDRPDKRPLRWHVPVTAQVLGHAAAETLVDGHATMKLEGCGPVLVNAGQNGYFRTLYAPAQLAALKNSFAKLAPIDQLGLMGDSWAQGMAGLQPVSDILDLAQATAPDAAPEIWADVAGSFYSLDGFYRGDNARQQRFRAYAIRQLKPVFARLGWQAQKDERTPVTLLRTQMMSVLAELGDEELLAEVRRRYDAQASDPNAVPPELRKTITSIIAIHADAATWDKLHAQARAEKTPLIKDRLYASLALAEDESLARRALDLALTDEPGATISAGMIAEVGYRHPELAYDFAMAHRAQVDKLVDSTSSSRYYPALGSSSFQPSMIDKIKAYEQTIAPTSRRAAETVIANIRYRMMIRNQRLPAVDAWLQQHGG